MAQHKFRITVTPIDADSDEPTETSALSFDVENHDDILKIAELIRSRDDLNFKEDEANAFAVGLKLFSEVMLRHPKDALFASLKRPFRDFMLQLKQGATKK